MLKIYPQFFWIKSKKYLRSYLILKTLYKIKDYL